MEYTVRQSVQIVYVLMFSRHSDAAAGLKETLNQLSLDYVDLFLVHWPVRTDFIFSSIDTVNVSLPSLVLPELTVKGLEINGETRWKGNSIYWISKLQPKTTSTGS
jgi:diketogulonate reductase-like aldo/keto reductase